MLVHNVRDGRRGYVGSWVAEPLVYAELGEKHVGRTVIYRSHNKAEAGTITSWRDGVVFARYSRGDTAAAADAADLVLGVRPLDTPQEISDARKKEIKMKPLCIYHGACDDGFAAAFIVRRALGADNVEFYAGVYDHAPPDVRGRDVIMVDFSYKWPVLAPMIGTANSTLILDHHKTAQEDLRHINPPPPFSEWRTGAWSPRGEAPAGAPAIRVAALFDMERSGAALAWDYFIGGYRPTWVEYVQDRDLWRRRMLHGDEFTIALRSYPQDFAVWDRLFGAANDQAESLIRAGADILRYYRMRVEEMKRTAYPAIIVDPASGDYVAWNLWVANAPYFAASEVAGELCDRDGAQFGACYFEAAPGRWQYSLRSRGAFDVGAVARRFGGGGHKNAAGFTVGHLVHGVAFDATSGGKS